MHVTVTVTVTDCLLNTSYRKVHTLPPYVTVFVDVSALHVCLWMCICAWILDTGIAFQSQRCLCVSVYGVCHTVCLVFLSICLLTNFLWIEEIVFGQMLSVALRFSKEVFSSLNMQRTNRTHLNVFVSLLKKTKGTLVNHSTDAFSLSLSLMHMLQ